MHILNYCSIIDMQNFDFKSVIILITALTALITGFYSIYHSKKTTYINAVTTARIKYMDNLRNHIAEFCGLTLHFSLTPLEENEKQQIIKKIDQLRFTIKLHLDRKNSFDIKVIEKINSIPNLTDPKKINELEKNLDKLTELTQDVLALEWNGIKLEASKGKLYNWQKNRFIKRHKKIYES